MLAMPSVRVNRKGADRVRSGHPWIFSSDVIERGTAQPGDAVRVLDHQGHNLGTGHYSSTSQITLRILSNHIEAVDETFLIKRIESALQHRQRVVSATNAYRL